MYARDINPRDGVFVNSGVESSKSRADTCLGFNSIRLTAVEYSKRYSAYIRTGMNQQFELQRAAAVCSAHSRWA
jgi:hypothetical protein